MALRVLPILRVNPPTLPTAGGTVRATFSAFTTRQSRLRADYHLERADGAYTLVGSTQLEPTAVSSAPQDYPKDLTLSQIGGGRVEFLQVVAVIHEVDAEGRDIENVAPITRRGPVDFLT